MPTPTPASNPTDTTPTTPAATRRRYVGFSPDECQAMLTGYAAGTPVRQIARTLDCPVNAVHRWLTANGVHSPRPHSNRLVRQLALILVGEGTPVREVAELIGVRREAISYWKRRSPVPAALTDVTYDETTLCFYRHLLSGVTPAAAAAASGRPLALLDPDAVYSSDVNTPVADQTPADPRRPKPRRPVVREPAAPQTRSLPPSDPLVQPTAPGDVSRRDRKLGRCRPHSVTTDLTGAEPNISGSAVVRAGQGGGSGQHRRNRAGVSATARPTRRRGRHSAVIPAPVVFAIPAPDPRMSPAAPVRRRDPDMPISDRYLTSAERDTIAVMLRDGESQAAIARKLGRHRSTINRELARNSDVDESGGVVYNPFTATRHATARRARPRVSKVYADPMLRALVTQRLEHWSPEQIAHRLRLDFPEHPEWHVCTETIYQAIYVYPKGSLRSEVKKALRTGRTTRKPRESGARVPREPDKVGIAERPAEIEDRAVPGDWEGDLICGAYNRSAIGTLVDRKTRYVMLLHLPGAHDALSVRDAMIARFTGMPERIGLSVTWDQGAEMALHKEISVAADLDVYFCDPHSPWQRGTNENTNGLLRQYFPKGTDLSVHGPERLREVEMMMNNRPRKTLNWATPAEAMWAELDGILGEA